MLMEVIDGFKIVSSVQVIVVNFGKKVVVGNIQIPYCIQKVGKLVFIREQSHCQASFLDEMFKKRKNSLSVCSFRYAFNSGKNMEILIALIHHAPDLPL